MVAYFSLNISNAFFVVIFVVWSLPIYYNKNRNATAKCAFFMYYK